MLAELTERLANATSIEANASLDDIWVTLTAAWPGEGSSGDIFCAVFAMLGISSLSLSQSDKLVIRDVLDSHGVSFRALAKDEQIIGGEGRTKVSLAVSR